MTGQAPGGDPAADAITALTAAYRAGEHTDYAALICRVVSSVAANAGGVEALLAGRPGSWEADHVREMVTSTTPEDELWRWRTEPLVLYVDVGRVFDDFGISDLYDDDLQTVELVIDTAEDPHTVAVAEATMERIEQLREADRAAYADAYTATITEVLAERGVTIDVEVIRTPDYEDYDRQDRWDAFSEDLHEQARQRTPLPMTGQAPDWSGGSPGDAVRRSGRSYTARAQENP
jgi:hypothetical protein